MKNNILPLELSSVAGADFTVGYGALGTLTKPCVFIRVINNSDQDITISYDGATDHDFVPSDSVFEFSVQALKGATNYAAVLPQGTTIYLKGSVATGAAYLSGYYQPV